MNSKFHKKSLFCWCLVILPLHMQAQASLGGEERAEVVECVGSGGRVADLYTCPRQGQTEEFTLCCPDRQEMCCDDTEGNVVAGGSKGGGNRDDDDDRGSEVEVVVAVVVGLVLVFIITVILIVCTCWSRCPIYNMFRRSYRSEGVVFTVSHKPATNIAMTSMIKLPPDNVPDRNQYKLLSTCDSSRLEEAPVVAENEKHVTPNNLDPEQPYQDTTMQNDGR